MSVILWLVWFANSASPAGEPLRSEVLVVVGAQGTEEYGQQFRQWADRWHQAAQQGDADYFVIGLAESDADNNYQQFKRRLSEAARGSKSQAVNSRPFWLILIGHGTFDGKSAKFNLRGPDVSANELAEWLKPIERPLAVINCSSSSGPFLAELSGPNRIVITATRSGHEYNFARFGDYFSAAINDPRADLDKDEQTSLLEAYLLASSRVSEFYASEGRLMTEHALLDDNGDKLGTPADWFKGVRATKSAKNGAAVDGLRAAQWHLVRSPQEEQLSAVAKTRRDELEQELARMRLRKSQLSEEEYLREIEPLLVELAKLYAR